MGGSYALIEGLGERLYPSGKARLAAVPSSVVTLMLWSISRIGSFPIGRRNALLTPRHGPSV